MLLLGEHSSGSYLFMIKDKSQLTNLSFFSIPNVLGAPATTLITGTYLHGKFLQSQFPNLICFLLLLLVEF